MPRVAPVAPSGWRAVKRSAGESRDRRDAAPVVAGARGRAAGALAALVASASGPSGVHRGRRAREGGGVPVGMLPWIVPGAMGLTLAGEATPRLSDLVRALVAGAHWTSSSAPGLADGTPGGDSVCRTCPWTSSGSTLRARTSSGSPSSSPPTRPRKSSAVTRPGSGPAPRADRPDPADGHSARCAVVAHGAP